MKLSSQLESWVIIVKRDLEADKPLSPPEWDPWHGYPIHNGKGPPINQAAYSIVALPCREACFLVTITWVISCLLVHLVPLNYSFSFIKYMFRCLRMSKYVVSFLAKKSPAPSLISIYDKICHTDCSTWHVCLLSMAPRIHATWQALCHLKRKEEGWTLCPWTEPTVDALRLLVDMTCF